MYTRDERRAVLTRREAYLMKGSASRHRPSDVRPSSPSSIRTAADLSAADLREVYRLSHREITRAIRV